jgi:hypothetical protein
LPRLEPGIIASKVVVVTSRRVTPSGCSTAFETSIR